MGDENDSSCILQVQHQHYKWAEIEFFWDKLKPDSSINWETPLAHLILQTPFATTIGNSSLEGAGGFSIRLGL